jgi:site-specific recombinase XerD
VDLKGRSLTFAVRFFLENYREVSTTKPASEAFAEFIAAKTAANLRPLSIRNLRVRVGRLVANNTEKSVSEITDKHVNAAVHRPGCSPKSRDNERRALSSFFTWAKKQGYCGVNPLQSMDPIRHERETPKILSVAPS